MMHVCKTETKYFTNKYCRRFLQARIINLINAIKCLSDFLSIIISTIVAVVECRCKYVQKKSKLMKMYLNHQLRLHGK